MLAKQVCWFLSRPWGCLCLVLWGMTMMPATALDLRIAIQQRKSQVVVGSSTAAHLVDGTGRQLGQLPAMQGFFAQAKKGSVAVADKQAWRISIRPTNQGFVYVGNRWYRGTVTLIKTKGGITAVNTVDLEDYLSSVVGKEVYASWPQAALKAQAVAARSFALYRWQRQNRKNSLYDLGDSTTYQVYSGVDGEAASTRKAVKETAGQVLAYRGKVIEAVFHASSGGHTENSENVWQSVTPYLRGVKDFDQEAPAYQWSLTLAADQIKRKIPGLGRIRTLSTLGRTFTGRVKTIRIVGTSGERTMTGRQLRQALGLKSTLFKVMPQTDNDQFQFMGQGHGHGLGMSQWGAYGLAKQGKQYQDILRHYYVGTRLTTYAQ